MRSRCSSSKKTVYSKGLQSEKSYGNVASRTRKSFKKPNVSRGANRTTFRAPGCDYRRGKKRNEPSLITNIQNTQKESGKFWTLEISRKPNQPEGSLQKSKKAFKKGRGIFIINGRSYRPITQMPPLVNAIEDAPQNPIKYCKGCLKRQSLCNETDELNKSSSPVSFPPEKRQRLKLPCSYDKVMIESEKNGAKSLKEPKNEARVVQQKKNKIFFEAGRSLYKVRTNWSIFCLNNYPPEEDKIPVSVRHSLAGPNICGGSYQRPSDAARTKYTVDVTEKNKFAFTALNEAKTSFKNSNSQLPDALAFCLPTELYDACLEAAEFDIYDYLAINSRSESDPPVRSSTICSALQSLVPELFPSSPPTQNDESFGQNPSK